MNPFFSFLLTRKPFPKNFFFKTLVLLFIIAWFSFFFTTRDALNWWIENILVLLFVPWFIWLQKKFTFNNAGLLCIFLFLIIHVYGAQMSYTYNQAGLWIQHKYNLWRNPYDRFVHFNFGLLITYPLYDYLRHKFLVPIKYNGIITTTILLALATWFELIEWAVAACTDSETGETYVATQGDVWDAHKDIVLAYIASIIIVGMVGFVRKKITLQKSINDLNRNYG